MATDYYGIEELATQLAQGLAEYSDEVAQEVKKAIDEETDAGVKDIMKKSPVLTGSYAKGWKRGTPYESKRSKRNQIYNKTDYQLTHLLEFPHVGRNGRIVQPKAHITTTDKEIQQNLERKIKAVIEK